MASDAPDTRTRTATRLLKSSAQLSYDPVVHIDWDAPLEPDRLFVPAHRCSLYGTPLWDGLTHGQQVELSKHEVASLASIGIWFESILMQMLVRHAYHRDPTTADIQYAFTEIGDETRHSIMFGKLIKRLDAPYYRPPRHLHWLGAAFKTLSNGPLTFGGTLFVEEILDQLQREAMADESVQPLVRAVNRVHVVEEARHMAYAREENAIAWDQLGPIERRWTQFVLGGVAYYTAVGMVNPRVYAHVGLRPREAYAVAQANPHWRETRRWAARKAVATLDEVGMIGGPGRWLWRRAGLV